MTAPINRPPDLWLVPGIVSNNVNMRGVWELGLMYLRGDWIKQAQVITDAQQAVVKEYTPHVQQLQKTLKDEVDRFETTVKQERVKIAAVDERIQRLLDRHKLPRPSHA